MIMKAARPRAAASRLAAFLACGLIAGACSAPVSGNAQRSAAASDATSAAAQAVSSTVTPPSGGSESAGAGASTPASPMTQSATSSTGDVAAATSPSPVRPQTPSSAPTSASGASTGVTKTGTGGTGSGALSDVFVGADLVDPGTYPGTVTAVGFQSPSGNIHCGFHPDGLVCQISEFTYAPPDLDCHGAGAPGATFGIDEMGDSFLFCAGDVEGGGPTLAYGKQIAVGSKHCVSREDGITCQDVTSGHGFKVARAAYQLY